jgi:hypothetical protein
MLFLSVLLRLFSLLLVLFDALIHLDVSFCHLIDLRIIALKLVNQISLDLSVSFFQRVDEFLELFLIGLDCLRLLIDEDTFSIALFLQIQLLERYSLSSCKDGILMSE